MLFEDSNKEKLTQKTLIFNSLLGLQKKLSQKTLANKKQIL
jgi:hypothetical protein